MRSRPCPQPGSRGVSYRKMISACRSLPSIGFSSWPRQRQITNSSGCTSQQRWTFGPLAFFSTLPVLANSLRSARKLGAL